MYGRFKRRSMLNSPQRRSQAMSIDRKSLSYLYNYNNNNINLFRIIVHKDKKDI